MNTPKIKVDHLTCKYPGSSSACLRDLSFSVKEGDFVILTGHQGSGISTLCYCLAGIIPSHVYATMTGNVLIDEKKTTEYGGTGLARKIGVVLQVPENQLLFLTIEDEVFFGLENLCLPREEILKITDEVLHVVGLAEYKKRHVRNLSGGQKQRLALAAILAMRPEVLVLDQPVSGLDPIGRREVLTSIKKINQDYGITVILAEKRLDDIVHLANTLIVLENGEILSQGPPHDILYKLDKAKIHIPQVVELFRKCPGPLALGPPHPITVEEALACLVPYLEKNPCGKFSRMKEMDEPTQGDVVVQLENVSYTYPDGGGEALKHVDLEIRKGEFVAILGQNGSGKSTLAKNLNGLLKPTAGRVLINGADTRTRTPSELSRMIAYVFQNPDHQILEKNVREEIALAPRTQGLSEDEIKKTVAENVARLKLDGLEEEDTFFLSRGLRQRVAIAASLSLGSDIVILDEPTTGQGSSEIDQIMALLKGLRERAYTILLITHDISVAAEYANRLVVLHEGSKIADGPTRKVLQQSAILHKTFIEPPQITRIAQSLQTYSVDPEIVTVDEFINQLNPSAG
jgi:energy-coupling factor transport system ATP-binding protein